MLLCAIFFFNDTATTEIYTLSLHDALPIFDLGDRDVEQVALRGVRRGHEPAGLGEVLARERVGEGEDARVLLGDVPRSEEHTSELQSRQYLVCRLLLEKKKKQLDIPGV